MTRRTFTLVDDNGDEQTFVIGSELRDGDVTLTDSALYAVQSLAPEPEPEPELPRVQRGDVLKREDAERVHICELVIRTGKGTVAQWRGDGWWGIPGSKWSDDGIRWPVTVIVVPEVAS